jgi:hypothetical protein
MPASTSRATWWRGMRGILISPFSAAKPLTSYRKYWAQRFGAAPFLPMSRAEMEALGWDECDIILVTGDAYIDHPSFGMALVGRLLEAQGFRVGIISQPDWQSAAPSSAWAAQPVLRHHRRQHGFDGQPLHLRPQDPLRRRLHANAAPTPRPDRAVIVYAQRCARGLPRRAAGDRRHRGLPAPHRHYDYWSDKVRRSILPDARPTCCCSAMPSGRWSNLPTAWPRASRSRRSATCAARPSWCPTAGCRDRTGPRPTRRRWTRPGARHAHPDPYAMEADPQAAKAATWRAAVDTARARRQPRRAPGAEEATAPLTRAIRLPSYEQVRRPGALRPRLAHLPPRIQSRQCPRAGPGPRRRRGERDVWLNPPPCR